MARDGGFRNRLISPCGVVAAPSHPRIYYQTTRLCIVPAIDRAHIPRDRVVDLVVDFQGGHGMVGTPRSVATLDGADGPTLQTLLADAVAEWKAAGVRVAGVIAEAHNLPDRTCSAGYLRDIGSGEPYAMFLEAPPAGTSCHLDAVGVEDACTSVMRQIDTSDVIVLSKFGKLEAAGGGLAPAFRAAIAAGKPLLTTVSTQHREAWRAIAPEAAKLPANPGAIRNWLHA
ncbi:MAG: DUF2478 domain-containing protein [Acetobacteraceae bacterium]